MLAPEPPMAHIDVSAFSKLPFSTQLRSVTVMAAVAVRPDSVLPVTT